MELEAHPKVQLILIYTEVSGLNLLLHGRDRLLHGTHAPLDSCQCLHNLRIAIILLWRQSNLGRRRHARYAYRNRRRRHIIIGIISPLLSIGLHQSLLADRILNLHLRLASNTDA
jgi:hypothetical protein